MVGAFSFLPIFLIGFTSAQCPTPCSLYKVFNVGELCGPSGHQFHCGGRWRLQSPNPHPKCTTTISGRIVNVCLYRRLEDNKEYCFCDPGNSIYEPWPVSGESCARDCLTTAENKTCVFWFILEHLYSDTPGRLADGFNRSVVVYNGKLPGPTITVCEGDDVVVNLINNLGKGDDLGDSEDEDKRVPPNSTTLHFHGIRQKQKSTSYDGYSEGGGPWSDGVPLVTQCPISACPSPTPTGYIPDPCIFTYKISGSGSIDSTYNNAPAGTYWYHSHVGRQRVIGAAGKLIIMPRNKRTDIHMDDPNNSMFLQEWFDEDGPKSLLVNGKGKRRDQFYKTDYEVFRVNPGTSYRFRIIGGIGDNHPIRVSVENHTFTAIATDSIDMKLVDDLDALWIAVGERYDIVIKTKTDPKVRDAYKINVFTNIEEELCSLAWLQYPQQEVDKTYEANCTEMIGDSFTKVLNPVPTSIYEWEDSNKYIYPKDFRALVNASNIESSLNTNQIVISGEFGTRFNYKHMKYPNIPFLFQSPSDNDNRCGVKCSPTYVNGTLNTVCNTNLSSTSSDCQHVIQQPWNNTGHYWFEIIFINGNSTAHPIHHHGGWFNIVGMGQFNDTELQNTNTTVRDLITKMENNNKTHRNFDLPVFKDTIQVPTNGYVIFRAPIDNSGVWIVHCHIEEHFAAGMAMVFQIGEPDGTYPWSMGPNQKMAQRNENLD